MNVDDISGLPRKVRAIIKFRSVNAAVSRMEALALEMLRHPTATDEQVLAMREMYRTTTQQMQEMKAALIGKGWIHGR